jgi:DNA-directed RNA polymerase specialized sigma24 family protein
MVQVLAQETYLRLLRARDLNEVRNPLAYLLQVASHVAMEWCDRQPRSDSMVVLDEDMLVDRRPPELGWTRRLARSVETAKTHVRNIMAKLGARDRTHAVTLAVRRGIMQL